ncbi:hypothetical protein GCM10010172_02150 [Paractinoplanes ferrugineus]|uniref:Uncharacterized protein n=1 Tax=Paractinoplanes ferrugineus TaxID=113564 RepID=A0A919J672_9ACTN|nr:hypothetical protein Afe05nite_59020 [Actinoplanes ferrugineus]
MAAFAAVMNRPGKYRYEISTAHSRSIFGTIKVTPSSGPSAMVFAGEGTVRTGDVITTEISGYPPASPVLADLYGTTKNNRKRMVWRNDLPPATTDQYGNAVIRWTVTRDIPTGIYAIVVEPVPENDTTCSTNCGAFRVVP